jgi:hypothetical protein
MYRSVISAISALIASAFSVVTAAEPSEEAPTSPSSYFRPVASVRGNTPLGSSSRLEPYLGPIGTSMPQSLITSSAVIMDFGDLHTFNVFFDRVGVTQSFEVCGSELMKQHVLFSEEGVNTSLSGWRGEGTLEGVAISVGDEVVANWQSTAETHSQGFRDSLASTKFTAYTTYGLRYAKLESDYFFFGLGSILGKASVLTEVDHDLFGPQVGIGCVAESDIWRFESTLLTMLGYQRIDYQQQGIFGEEAIPGALNRSATARTTSSHEAYGEEHAAWLNELRLTASCRLTPQLRIDGGWRAALATQFHGAAYATAWNAPEYGIRPLDGETVVYDYWTLGLTYEF